MNTGSTIASLVLVAAVCGNAAAQLPLPNPQSGGGGVGQPTTTPGVSPANPAAADPARRGPQTNPEDEPPVYSSSQSPLELLTPALVRAGKRNQRVILCFGADWSRWSRYMHARLTRDPELGPLLDAEYQVVFIDIGTREEKLARVQDITTAFGVDLEKHGVPYLTILDSTGNVLLNAETSPYRSRFQQMVRGFDPQLLMPVLKEHITPRVDAEQLVKIASERAGADHKKLLVVFRQSMCSWCDRMDAWLETPEVASVLAKDYEVIRVDMDRMSNAIGVFDRFVGGLTEELPWYIITTPDGVPVVNSNMPRDPDQPRSQARNIGFPQAAPELAHLRTMLERSRKHMTSEEADALVQSIPSPVNKKPDQPYAPDKGEAPGTESPPKEATTEPR
jgi:hypothetical protein